MHEPRSDAVYGEYGGDFSWVVGRLAHEPIEGGFWVLEFGAADAPHNGQLVLGNPAALHGLESGQLVRVEGGLAAEQFGFQMAGTRYEVRSAQAVDG